MKNKFVLIFISLFVCLTILSGCYDVNSVETLTYAVAIGIDKEQENVIKLTLQFAVPKASDSSFGSSQASTSTIVDIKCTTIDEGISLINSYLSKKVDLSHCKVIVFSEQLAHEGLFNYILSLMNNVQVRPDCNIIISRCDAYDFLSNSIPTLESVPAKYYELILNSSEYTGYTESIYLSEFYERLLNNRCEPIGILGGINIKENQDSLNVLENGYKADETPIETQNNIENMGLAVFSGDTLIGELNGIETLCHMIISNSLKNATITIPHPFNLNTNISIYLNLKKPTKNTVKIVNDYPYITSKIWVSGYILNVDNSLDLTDEKNIKDINTAVSAYLNNCIKSYLYKTSKDFHSDIDDFGSCILYNYITNDDWKKADWLNNYKNSFFNVDVNCNITSSNLFNKF